MSRIRFCLVILMILVLPSAARAEILNIKSGIYTEIQRDRDWQESEHYTMFLLETSYSTSDLKAALEFPLRWDSSTRKFDNETWSRKGDFLKPLKLLRYHSDGGQITAGFEIFTNWTPGEGFLVRDLSGRGEIDYILPGLRIRWSDEAFDLDAGMDRPVDPTVQALAVTWRAFKGVTLLLEGAVDPKAPVVFSGSSDDGRPVADDSDRLTAKAAGVRFELVDGKVLDLDIGAHAADINGDAKGIAGELSATLDFSEYYRNRLHVRARTTACEGGYIPGWFDAVYPVLRWGPEGQPILGMNPLDGSLPDKSMLSIDIEYDLGSFFSVKGGYDMFRDDSLRRARFEAQLREENSRGLKLSFWSRADDPAIRLFSEDSNLYSEVSALYNFLPHFLFNVSFQHAWAFKEEEAGFRPLNSVQIGVLYDISL